jgi:glycosyltransferase involved in cell wall biosynthesis
MLASASIEQRLLRPVVLGRPQRLVWPPSWATHIPFAFWIVDVMRPRTFVELGTHTGVSYSAFAQAVQTLGLTTACYAIDTWEGDAQAGFYGDDVFAEWSAFHDRQFGGFSRLVRSTFDAALPHFTDGSIDLLHIDGLHTYEAVRHDFETWAPKLSRQAVVLLHDINVREGEFGAWKYWDEAGALYPSFTFMHGHGLGVLAVGREQKPDVSWLTSLAAGSQDVAAVHRVFSTIGDLWQTHIFLDRAREDAARVAAERDREAQARANVSAQLADSTAQLSRITAEFEASEVHVRDGEAKLALMAGQLEVLRTEAKGLREALEREREFTQQLADDMQATAIRLVEEDQELAALRTDRADGSGVPTQDDEIDRVRRQALMSGFEARNARRQAVVSGFARAAAAQTPQPARGTLGRVRRRLAWSGISRRLLVRDPVGAVRALAANLHPGFRQNVGLLGASALFDPDFYAAHPVVAGVPRGRLREHFLRYGDRAGISPHPLFDPQWYRERNPDLPRHARLLFHYLRFGAGEGRDPHPLFRQAHYIRQLPGGLSGGVSPLAHFVQTGVAEGLSPHPLFDTTYYLQHHPGLVAAGHNPLLNYLNHGNRDRIDPHPLFSTSYYIANNPDVGTAINPLVHFVARGAREGRDPHPLFDIAYYWQQRPDIREAGVNALEHYLASAILEDVDPHPLFDTSFYLRQTGTVSVDGFNPLVHFVEGGWREGFRPNEWFDPLWYREQNPDIDPLTNPLVHFVLGGWREGRDPSPRFSTRRYLEQHPEVEASGENPLAHFLRARRLNETLVVPLPSSSTQAPARAFQVTGTADTPRTILVVSHVSPWPVRAGNEYRMHRLLRHWKRLGYRIVLVLAPIASEPLVPGAFDRAAEDFGNVVLCHPDGRVTFRLRDCPNVVSNLAGTVVAASPIEGGGTVFGETDRAFCHDVVFTVATRLAQTLGPSVVVAEYIFMTRFLPFAGSHVLKVVDTHDIFSKKGTNVIAYGVNDVTTPAGDEARRLERADVIVAIHSADAHTLAELAPGREVIVAGVDAEVWPERAWPAEPVVFVAGSDNALNVAGLRDFLRFSWPQVRSRVPSAQLRVAGGVGRAVPPGTRGVHVLGYVPDLAVEYGRARVAINPTVAGTGLKIKTVESLAHLTPVVGWPNGRDGLSDGLSAFVYEARDWQDFADAVVRALERREAPFGAMEVDAVRNELSPEVVYRTLDDRLERFFRDAGL